MSITIRQAQPQDAHAVVPLIIDAIGDIANRLTGEQSAEAVMQELTVLFQREDNRHSYLNTFVATENEHILGILVYYHGAQAVHMDANLVKWLEAKMHHPLLLTEKPMKMRLTLIQFVSHQMHVVKESEHCYYNLPKN